MSTYFRPYKDRNYSTWPTVTDTEGKPHTLTDIRSYEFQNPTYTNKAKNAFILEDRTILEKVAIRHIHGLRGKVLESASNCCAKCGRNLSLYSAPYEIHHRLPRVYGGTNRPDNLIPLCREPCHLMVTVALQRRDKNAIEALINAGILDLPFHIISKLFPQ